MVRKSSRFSHPLVALPFVGVGILAAATAAIGNAQAVPRITRQVETSPLVSLPGAVHPWAQARFDRGPAPASLSGHMLVTMRRSPAQESALQALITSQQDPNSPNYHKWLKPDQFGKQFGVADADLQTVTAYLASQGLSVGRVYSNHMAIEVSATVEQVHSTFQTDIHAYSVGGKTFYANATAPKIPAALQGVVSGITSLNNFKPTTGPNAGTQASFDPQTHKLTPNYTISGETAYGITPGDLAKIYDIPAATSTTQGMGGANVNVGVIGDSNINVNYINNYRTVFKLGAKTPIVVVDGNDPGINDDAYIAYKQIELIAAVAPNANIYYYTSAATDYDNNGLDFAMVRAVDDNQVQILVNGYQSCETVLQDRMLLYNQVEEQAAAQGMTVVVAAGNSGSAACEAPGVATSATSALAVNGYAKPPYVTAVGGTDFYYNGTSYWNTTNSASNSTPPYTSAKSYIPEQAWNDSNTNLGPPVILAGGGGVSTYSGNFDINNNPLPQPMLSYQSSNANASAIGKAARVLPDVSFFAGGGPTNTIGYPNSDGSNGSGTYNFTAYMFCMQSSDCSTSTPQFTYSGGTEASSAVFAGAMALVVQHLNNASPYGMGNANPALYYLLPAAKVISHDIQRGSNALVCTGTNNCAGGVMTGYNAGTGYDAATGLGSFDIGSFVTNYSATPQTTASVVTLTVLDPQTGLAPVCGTTPNCTTHSNAVEFKVKVIGAGGTPTGDVTLLSTSPLASLSAVATVMTLDNTGTADNNYFKTLPGGTYNLYARYAGDGTYASSVSTQYPITVQPEGCHVIVYKNTATGTVNYGTPVVITAEPYSVNGVNNVAIPSGSFNVTDTFTPAGSSTSTTKMITTLPFNSQGAATFSSNLLAYGSHSIVLTFPGDASFTACNTPAYAFSVQKANTTTTLLAADSNTGGGRTTPTIAITAVVQSATSGNGTPPTGQVTFYNSNGAISTVNLVSGFDPYGNAIATGSLIVSQNNANTPIYATYIPGGDLNYNASTSATLNLSSTAATFNYKTATSFTITDNTGTYAANQLPASFPVLDTMTLNITTTAAQPDSSWFQVYANGTVLSPPIIRDVNGNYVSGGVVPDQYGNATFVLPQLNGYLDLPSGQVVLAVVYDGNISTDLFTEQEPSSAIETLTIVDDRTSADFSLQSDTTVNQKNPLTNAAPSATYNLRLTSIYNMSTAYGTTPINLGCSVVGYVNTSGVRSTPTGLTCGFNTSGATVSVPTTSTSTTPASPTFKANGTSPGFITMPLYVGATTGYGIASNEMPAPASPWWLATGGTTLACIFLLGLPKRRRNWQSMLGACAIAIISFGMTGCGVTSAANKSQLGLNGLNGASGNGLPNGIVPVPAGTYTVLITASATTNTSVVHTLPVQVVVTAN